MAYDVYVGHGLQYLDAPKDITTALEKAGLSCKLIPRDAQPQAGGMVSIPRADASRLIVAVVQSGDINEKALLHQCQRENWEGHPHLAIMVSEPKSPELKQAFASWETLDLRPIPPPHRRARIVAAVKARLGPEGPGGR